MMMLTVKPSAWLWRMRLRNLRWVSVRAAPVVAEAAAQRVFALAF